MRIWYSGAGQRRWADFALQVGILVDDCSVCCRADRGRKARCDSVKKKELFKDQRLFAPPKSKNRFLAATDVSVNR